MCVFLQASCRKPEDNTIYTISGTLIQSCGGAPYANQYMEMYQNWFSGPGNSQRLYTYTDNHGRFKFEYKDQTGEPISLWYGSNSNNTFKIFTSVPAKQNLELGNVYINGDSNFYIKLNTVNTYSPNDTLYFTNFHEFNKKHKLSGPFSNGLLDSLNNVSIGDAIYPDAHSQLTLGWKLNQGNWNLVHFDVRPCDTSIVQINLN